MSEREVDARRSLAAMNDVLRVVLRHPNLLLLGPFQELAATVRKWVPFAHMGVLTPLLDDGPDETGAPAEGQSAPAGTDSRRRSTRYKRLYSASLMTAELGFPFGGRVHTVQELDRAVYGRGERYVCDDTTKGELFDQQTARAGYRSYVALPVRSEAPARPQGPPAEPSSEVVAELVVAFVGVGEASASDLELLQQIADVLGASFGRLVASARERRLAMILETSTDAMLAWDLEGKITDLNAAATELVGRPRDELIGAPIASLLDPPPDVMFAPTPGDGERKGRHEGRMTLRARGDARIVVGATLTRVEHDALVHAHVLLRDLTRVVASEREAAAQLARINELEEQHRTLLDNAPFIIFRLDPRTTELVYLNGHAERVLGVPVDVALASPGFLRETHEGEEGERAFASAVARAQKGSGSFTYEARLRRTSGDPISARGTVYPLLAEGGEVAAIEGVLVDVSAEQTARRRLVQTDRLATLGTLAAGVAHEINNPAAFILLGLDMLERVLRGQGVSMNATAEQSAHELLRELKDSIARVVEIARDLRTLASPPALQGARKSFVDVVRTVESALSLTRGQILERAEIIRELDDVPAVMMEDGRLGQVVVNLLVNAAQAIQRAPRGAGARDRDAEDSITVTTRSDGHTVEIAITDTGVGVPEENQTRIWQPFFTTKPPELGTGLGLSISRDIVERAGGTIRIESPVVTAGGTRPGTRFVVSLPVAAPVDSATPISSPLPAIPRERVRVLIVEDEAALGRALAEELGHLHDVTLADSAERALEFIEQGPRFGVVLCDLQMRGMGGKGLYATLVARDPAQAEAFVFMTGAGFGADREGFLKASRRPVLEKPFTPRAAEDAIARVVAGRLAAKLGAKRD